MIFRPSEFAEIADGLAVRERVVPDKTGGRIRQRVAVILAAAARITARKSRELALHVIRRDAGVGPIVAVRAQRAAAISVVEQNKIAHELVLVWRHALA